MTNDNDLVKNSSLYREFQAERDEILKSTSGSSRKKWGTTLDSSMP